MCPSGGRDNSVVVSRTAGEFQQQLPDLGINYAKRPLPIKISLTDERLGEGPLSQSVETWSLSKCGGQGMIIPDNDVNLSIVVTSQEEGGRAQWSVMDSESSSCCQ